VANFAKTFFLKYSIYNLFISLCMLLAVASCTNIDLYEKTAAIPGQKWSSSFKPSFTFAITDTSALYQVWFVFRHTEKYNFNNIYINLRAQVPGQDTSLQIRQDVKLATDDRGWLATGMDDIYEHREPLGPAQTFKAGEYTFTLEQIMREDPLNHVLDAGIRIEKQ